jgi:hypothetical protein
MIFFSAVSRGNIQVLTLQNDGTALGLVVRQKRLFQRPSRLITQVDSTGLITHNVLLPLNSLNASNDPKIVMWAQNG